jgi:hypothetical protein
LVLSGGIDGDGFPLEHGGIGKAWTTIAWLPGGALLAAGGPFAPMGVVLLVVGSWTTGCMATFRICEILRIIPAPADSPWRWRMTLAVWLVWVPVPVSWTITIWFPAGP